jgi:hypothetical protein
MSRTMERVVMLVLLLVVAATADASAVDGRAAANRLTGCRNTSTGTLDQVRGGSEPLGGSCGAGEVAVSWNRIGPQGPAGAPGVSGWEIVQTTSVYSSVSPRLQTAACPAGKKVVGGGGVANPVAVLYGSSPTAGGDGWSVLAIESPATTADWYLDAFAICVTALP